MGAIIYGLVDPRTGHLRYVGKTSGTTHKRKLAHINDVRRGRVYIPRHRWMAELLELGLEPEVFEIEVSDDWREAEQFWIAYFRMVGCDLLNATAGGEGLCSYRHSAETRAKQAKAAKHRYERDSERAKTGSAVSRALRAPEVRQKLRDSRSKVSVASKQICLDALIARSRSAEGRAATSARMKGRTVSEETRKKLSAAAKGKVWTEEQREAARQRRIGYRHSEETKARMSVAAIARYSKV